jgi:hypothetical protein
VVAGPTIGDRRTFFLVSLNLLAFRSQEPAFAVSPTKPSTNHSCKAKNGTAFENYLNDRSRPGGAGRTRSTQKKKGERQDHQFDKDATSLFNENQRNRRQIALMPV